MKTIYHASETKLAAGTKLQHRGNYNLDAFTNDVLETTRPRGLPRRNAVTYGKDEPDFSNAGLPYNQGYQHTIKAEIIVGRFDYGWIGQLQQHVQNPYNQSVETGVSVSSLDPDEIGRRYWAKEASRDPNWEYLCVNAEVLDCLDAGPRYLGGDTIAQLYDEMQRGEDD